jgi:hypothetical protein
MTTPAWAVPIPDLPDAACKGAPLEWFVVTPDYTGRRTLTLENLRGLDLCRDCPDRLPCSRLPLMREDLIFGGVAYGATTKGRRPNVLHAIREAS